MTTLVVEVAQYKTHGQTNRLTFYVGCWSSRLRHEELDKHTRPQHSRQQICRGRGFVNTILFRNSKSGTGRQTDGRTDGHRYFLSCCATKNIQVPRPTYATMLRLFFISMQIVTVLLFPFASHFHSWPRFKLLHHQTPTLDLTCVSIEKMTKKTACSSRGGCRNEFLHWPPGNGYLGCVWP